MSEYDETHIPMHARVLPLVVAGKNNKEIAAELKICVARVRICKTLLRDKGKLARLEQKSGGRANG
jgi:FixJ family two-component response regulator